MNPITWYKEKKDLAQKISDAYFVASEMSPKDTINAQVIIVDTVEENFASLMTLQANLNLYEELQFESRRYASPMLPLWMPKSKLEQELKCVEGIFKEAHEYFLN